jgi:hypothetical protein
MNSRRAFDASVFVLCWPYPSFSFRGSRRPLRYSDHAASCLPNDYFGKFEYVIQYRCYSQIISTRHITDATVNYTVVQRMLDVAKPVSGVIFQLLSYAVINQR